ncbi:MAG: DNA-binding protein [Candidatus Methylomirabilota bacterium]|nr:Arc family DNA-binding protein [Candidatus Methylomirabilis sp.]NJD68614.1 Arc family DNA-binding protein [candidate division NC10 bacterium]PWB46264.1 MAG: DNA-binding protein [candidate division NC10 bacterium]
MPAITVKNIPPDLYELLKRSAAANRRSINSEVITCIERVVRGRKINTEALLARARELRRQTRRHPIADSTFKAAKLVGRP